MSTNPTHAHEPASDVRAAPKLKRIPNPAVPVPPIAWPTLGLFVAALGLWGAGTALYVADVWPWPLSTLVNTIATFMLFTVVHDASHRSVSTSNAVNVWLGRVAALFVAPTSGFSTFRFIHMQHHRFTNDAARDPDHYTNPHGAPHWQLPLRWLTIDLWYGRFYLRRLKSRPRREKVELAITYAVVVGILATAIATGYGFEALVLWLVPHRLEIGVLGWSFDYLPHSHLTPTALEDNFRATRNRVGAERLLTPLLLYQNYHLVHHLHPIIPFYRYISVWRRREEEYLAHQPALSDWRGRELTVEEYRRIRELAHH